MIFNNTTLTLELLTYYFKIWKRPPPPSLSSDEIERLRKENAQRVLTITKWAFVSALSLIEYSAKETLKIIKDKSFKQLREKLQQDEPVYLRTIMKKSQETKLIDEKQYKTWKTLIKIRNVIVHNNAIADINAKFEINDMKITFIKGEMLKGKLDFFVKLLEITIDHWKKWLHEFLIAHFRRNRTQKQKGLPTKCKKCGGFLQWFKNQYLCKNCGYVVLTIEIGEEEKVE